MAYTFLIFILSVQLVKGCAVCGPNEVPKDGIDCTSDCCPVSAGEPDPCPDPCATACKCEINYKRAANGTCIPARDCPAIACGDCEVYDSCPVCNENCTNASPDGRRCRYVGNVLYTVICEPACRCIDNYWRDDNGVCVTYDQCIAEQGCK